MNYTSIEQSKKLLKLGLNPESSDMECGIPCWSVGALFEILPDEIKAKNDIGEYVYTFRMMDKRTIEYGCYINKFDDYWKPMISYAGDDFLDVCYNMVVWLLENGYIKIKTM